MSKHTTAPKVSVVVATYNRKEELQECIESVLDQAYEDIEVVVISNSTDGTPSLFEPGGPFHRDDVRFFHFDGRMGVAEARNEGFERANGDILVTLDDDAVFVTDEAIANVVSEFQSDSELGILSFQSINCHSNEIEDKKVPALRKEGNRDREFRCSYFIGVGNAIRAEALAKAGYYPPDYQYGFEEIDLSLRVIQEGYHIMYFPEVTVLHKESPEGRFGEKNTIYRKFRNRTKTGIKYMPWRYVIVSTLLWSAFSIFKARGDPRPVGRGLWYVVTNWGDLVSNRQVIDQSTLRYLKENHGRLYF